MSGDYTRAVAALVLEARPDLSREQLVRRIHGRLAALGLSYHLRTLRRQLAGTVASVPPELEAALRAEATALLALDADALAAKIGGVEPRGSPHVPVRTLAEIAALWLYLHPGRSKRSLAIVLSRALAAEGISLGLDALQGQLAGQGQIARREVLDALVATLAPHGIDGLDAARRRAAELAPAVEERRDGRRLVGATAFVERARAWMLRERSTSSRPLAELLVLRLAEREVHVGLHHLQRAIAGRVHRIRAEVDRAMAELLADGEAAPGDASDLEWVDAAEVVALAHAWLEQHPGQSMRRLALELVAAIERLGYRTNVNTIQPILGGWKRRTRGFVRRAMASLSPPRRPAERPPEATDVPLTWERYLEQARAHAPLARSPHFVSLAAIRAEHLFGIARADAAAAIAGAPRASRRAREEAAPWQPTADDVAGLLRSDEL